MQIGCYVFGKAIAAIEKFHSKKKYMDLNQC